MTKKHARILQGTHTARRWAIKDHAILRVRLFFNDAATFLVLFQTSLPYENENWGQSDGPCQTRSELTKNTKVCFMSNPTFLGVESQK